MPTYQYACTQCDERLEAVQAFSDAPLTECPACEGRLRKVYSAVGVVFKGSGFYKNDSRSANAKDGERGGDKAADGGGEKADKGAADKGDKGGDKAGAPAKPAAKDGGASNGRPGGTSGGKPAKPGKPAAARPPAKSA